MFFAGIPWAIFRGCRPSAGRLAPDGVRAVAKKRRVQLEKKLRQAKPVNLHTSADRHISKLVADHCLIQILEKYVDVICSFGRKIQIIGMLIDIERYQRLAVPNWVSILGIADEVN